MILYQLKNGIEEEFKISSESEQIRLSAFTYNATRMGSAPTISATLLHPVCLDNYWTDGVYVKYKDERYFIKQIPTSSYSADDIMYKHELEFVSERVALENVYFYDVVDAEFDDDKPVSNKSEFSFSGDIHQFAERLNQSLQYAGLEYSVVVDDGIESDDKLVTVENNFFSAVLQDIYNVYDLPYYFVGKVIHIGHSANAIDEVFSYGVNDALLSVSKANAGNRVINRITGLGSEDNIPYYYPNLSPKGDIQAKAGENNTGITDDNITIIDYEKYAENVELDGEIKYNRKDISNVNFSIHNNVSQVNPNEYFEIYSSRPSADSSEFIDVNMRLSISSILWNTYDEFAVMQVLPQVNINANWYGVSNYPEIDTTIYPTPQYSLKLDKVIWRTEKQDDTNRVWYNVGYEELKPSTNDGWYVLPRFGECSQKTFVEAYYTLHCHIGAKYEITQSWQTAEKGVWTLKDKEISTDSLGIKLNRYPEDGDTITQKLVRYINPQKNLMPPIYRQTDGAERFYNALNNTYQNPEEDEGIYYEFENPFVEGRPKEQIVQFDEVKPTIKDVKNSEGLRIDMFSEFAYDRDDNDDIYTDANGQTNYTHPYFFAKLRKLDFNLFDSAIDEGEMTIAMTSGNCGACEFIVGVDAQDKFNTVQVDENGNLIYDSNGNVLCGRQDLQNKVDPQPQQQDTINNEVWIALEKDTKTFGVLIPNVEEDYKPKACTKNADGTYNNDGDTFVILHINLPQLYIEKAEEDLYDQIIRFMYDNNFEKFNFSIKFSRIYLAEHPEILALLDENARIKIMYNGQEHLLYVSSFTYKVTDSEVLPEITVELKDNLAVSQNAVQRAVNKAVADVYKTIGNIDVIAQANEHFLRSDQPDVAYQQITFEKNAVLRDGATLKGGDIKTDDYYSDVRGLAISKDKDGNWHIEADYLKARKKFSAKEVEIQKVYHIGGAQIKSSANMICSRVEDAGDAYRCYMETTDDSGNTIYNQFIEGDQAYVQTFNLITDENGNTTNHFYWRLVTGVGDDFILLSKTICAEGSTIPMVGDNIVQLGCQNGAKPERMVAVIDAGAGDDAPYYRQFVGIRDFSLPEPETQLQPNNNILTGRVTITGGSGLENLTEWTDKQSQIDTANENANSANEYITTVLPTELDNLQKQIDGVIDSYFYPYYPTLTNFPANQWITAEEKERHLGDTFTNISSLEDDTENAGKSWRWSYTDAEHTGYHWHPIADSDAVLALQKAAAAQATADGKVRTFVSQPTTPYSQGDFWYDAGGRLKMCIASRQTGSFSASDWTEADTIGRVGQNLVKGSGTPIKKESHWEPNFDWYSYPTSCILVRPLEKGKTYTVSCQTTGEWSNTHNPSVQSNKVTLWISDLTNYSVIISDVNTSTGTTFVWDRDYVEGYPQKIRFNTYGNPQQFWNLKIEEGSTATPWSLAPEEQSVVYHNLSNDTPIAAKEGDIWIPSDAPHTTYTYKNGVWVISGDSTGTVIDNGLITSGTIQLGDPNYTAKAGITGAGTTEQSVRIWAGSGQTDKNNAPFRVLQDGTMYANKGVFSGLVRKNPTHINTTNYTEYLTQISSNAQGGYDYMLDLTKTGSFVVFDEWFDDVNYVHLYLPEIEPSGGSHSLQNESDKDALRGLIGETIIIKNKASQFLNVCTSRFCTVVEEGSIRYYTLKAEAYNSTSGDIIKAERLYWDSVTTNMTDGY